ncbi:unnamed protein product [Phaeothamnion confervicola]
MGGILACMACQAACALCSVCCSCAGCMCGAATEGKVPRDPMVGKMRSFGLVIFSIVLGLVFQYKVAEYLYDNMSQWQKGCSGYSTDYQDICAGNAAIYRVSFVDVVFFVVMALCAPFSGRFNNRFWGLKLIFWALFFVAMIFVPNNVFDDNGYVWPARFGAFIFTILQQVVLIDIAYTWNDQWVKKAQQLGEDGEQGRKYLVSLVAISSFLFAAAIVVLGFLFHYFRGCPANDLILSITLILCVVLTALQLSGDQGNLLASAIVAGYAVFLAYSSVSKNPHKTCNPLLGETNVTSIIIGLILTVLSLAWVCLSSSSSLVSYAHGLHADGSVPSAFFPEVVLASSGPQPVVSDEPAKQEKLNPQRAVVVDQESGAEPSRPSEPPAPAAAAADEPPPEDGGAGWKFNIVMALICTYFAMLLTNWGDIQTSTDTSDPKNGRVALWMTAAGQWIALLLYGWTLVAPRLFPDRDFS